MSTTEIRQDDDSAVPDECRVDMNIEVVVVPVSDVDRAKDFYRRLGWRLDVDKSVDRLRLVQFTPPGSGCSIQFGENLTSAVPGSADDLYLIVSDITAAHDELVDRGIDVEDVYHCGSGFVCRFDAASSGRISGSSPDGTSYGTYCGFSDPDGNRWLFQEVTTRIPGRMPSDTTAFSSVRQLASAMRRASKAHGEHEARIGKADPDWPDWYATYMVAEQRGTDLPS